ncbi:hypothetical protein ABDD95_20400 [Mucilaginibacter sp. PAMB04274]|uniref:hypothetical protein n=1 Tax=Mucilaginibacter sp. PAMB04274 TaxID=3138568 RepID=UPI0031F636FC
MTKEERKCQKDANDDQKQTRIPAYLLHELCRVSITGGPELFDTSRVAPVELPFVDLKPECETSYHE